MILVGSKTDKEVENIQINEKLEIVNDKERDDFKDKNKRRFKKIEKVEKKKKDYEDNKVVLTYEGFYVQEAERKIESIINVDVPQLGINEITSKVIGTVIDNDKKIKKEKIIEKNKKLLEEEKERERKRTTSSRFILHSLPSNTNISSKNIKSPLSNANIKVPKLNLMNINNNIEDKNHQTVEVDYSKNKFKSENNKNEIGKAIKPKIMNNQTSRNISFPKKNFSNIEISNNLFNKNIKRIKSNNRIKIRNDLFSERLFTKTYREKEKEEMGKLTERKKFSKKVNSLKLPFLGDKIIFNKGETEKLLNYQFYNTSYRACCHISQYNNIPNSSMKINYTNNWNIVTNYVNDKKIDEYKSKNKKDFRNKTEYK